MLEMMLKSINKKKSNQKGFTLVELIVVIAILGILAAIAIPRFAGFSGNANAKATLATLSSIDSAIQSTATSQNKEAKDVADADVLATIGWSAFPKDSPKGVTYKIVTGVATATVADTTPWVKDKTKGDVTAETIKAY